MPVPRIQPINFARPERRMEDYSVPNPSVAPIDFAGGMANAQASAAPAMQAAGAIQAREGEIKKEEAQLSQRDQAIAFQEMLRGGSKTARAYIQDLRTRVPTMMQDEERKQKVTLLADNLEKIVSQYELAQQDPKFDGKAATEMWKGFYSSADNQLKDILDPTWQEKQDYEFKQQKELENIKAGNKANKPSVTAEKRAAGMRDYEEFKNQVTAFESTPLKLEDISGGDKVVEGLNKTLTTLKAELETLKGKPKPGVGKYIPGVENRVEKRDRLRSEIAELESILKDPIANIGVIKSKYGTDTGSLVGIDKKIEEAQKKRENELGDLKNKMEKARTQGLMSPAGERYKVIDTEGDSAKPSAAPAKMSHGQMLTKLMQEQKNATGDTLARINKAIEKLQSAGIKPE